MLNETVISIFFRLINFGMLIYAAKYVYDHYVYNTVVSDIEADEKKIAMLAQQKDAFYHHELFVVKEIENQQQTVAHLMRVLEKWRATAEQNQRMREEEHQKLEEALRKKAAEQSEHIAEYMLARRALPQAVHELEASLTNYFNRENRASEYIASTIKQIDKDR